MSEIKFRSDAFELAMSPLVPRTELWFVTVDPFTGLKVVGKIVDLAYEPNPTLQAAANLWTGGAK